MDKKQDSRERWAWLPKAMPAVAQLVAERRVEYGAAHVSECWQRGMAGEPGWFFAREGPIAIGTPWLPEQDATLAELTSWQRTSTQALVIIKKPEVMRGTYP